MSTTNLTALPSGMLDERDADALMREVEHAAPRMRRLTAFLDGLDPRDLRDFAIYMVVFAPHAVRKAVDLLHRWETGEGRGAE